MFFMCFDKHCHVQIRVVYEGEFVAKCLQAYVDWAIKNLKAYNHGDEDWFKDLEKLVGSGPTPQEKLENITFEICRVRSVRLPVPSSGLAFMRECL